MSKDITINRIQCRIPAIKFKGNASLSYETVGRFTSWNIECDCCGQDVLNSTEIDIRNSLIECDESRINACHECSNMYIYPSLEGAFINNPSLDAQKLKRLILTASQLKMHQ